MKSSLCVPILMGTALLHATHLVPLNSLQLNGSATLTNGVVVLTTNLDQAGSAFIPTPYTFGPNYSFVVSFAYQAAPSTTTPPADGLALVIQNTTSGPSYLGEAGSGMGFFTGNADPSVGVTFDYFQNGITGSQPGTAAIATPSGVEVVQTIPSLAVFGGGGTAGIRYVWVAYSNARNKMAVFYSNTSTLPATPILEATLPQDISSLCSGQIYIGLSGGTGSLDSIQSIGYLAVDVVNDAPATISPR
jgi:hypothetical protein